MARAFLRTPLHLPIILSLTNDDTVLAEFPSFPGCTGQGKIIDEAILGLAKTMQSYLEAGNVVIQFPSKDPEGE